MRDRRGFRPVVLRAAPPCPNCAEPGEVLYAGALYCPCCALAQLIKALGAEIGVDPSPTRSEVPIGT